MTLTIGQCDELTQRLLTVDGKADSDALAIRLGVDEEVFLIDLDVLRQEQPSYLFSELVNHEYDGAIAGVDYTRAVRYVWIPKRMKKTVQRFMNQGGGKHFEEKFRRESEKEAEELRRWKLQEENLIAATNQARVANITAWIASIIALASLIVSIVALSI